jgi:hypothetical protein
MQLKLKPTSVVAGRCTGGVARFQSKLVGRFACKLSQISRGYLNAKERRETLRTQR